MAISIAIDEAQMRLREIIARLSLGGDVIITDNQQPVARLVKETAKPAPRVRPGPGLCQAMITYIAPDFDAPLADMREYMR